MIIKDEMLPLLVEACPSFAGKWQAHKLDYEDEEAYLPYIALGEFANHLVEIEEQGLIGEVEAVFAVVERLHIEGDAYVKEASTIGLLEDIQNVVRHKNINDASLRIYLQPISACWWEELNRFWNGEIQFIGESFK